jgi:hypothetical protein
MRLISLLGAPAAAAVLLAAGCGGSDDPAPGSAQNPMVATTQAKALPKAADRKAARVSESADASGAKVSSQKGAAKASADGAPASATGGGEAGSASKSGSPNYEALLAQKGSPKGSRFTPCNLVSQRRAEAILGGKVAEPLEAPQGPTCIYRTVSGKSFVTIAVQGTSFAKLRKQLVKPEPVTVQGRAGYCGKLGQPMLYVPLGTRKLLTVAAPCDIAKAFAATAVQRLAG